MALADDLVERARPEPGRERRPLVGPVRVVDGRLLDDDHPGTARGTRPVVGDMPIGKRAAPGEVGLVRAEHEAGPGLPATQEDRVDQ